MTPTNLVRYQFLVQRINILSSRTSTCTLRYMLKQSEVSRVFHMAAGWLAHSKWWWFSEPRQNNSAIFYPTI